MNRAPLAGVMTLVTMGLGACSNAPAADDFGYKGTGIAIGVAPLDLAEVSDACYSFEITNGLGQRVIARGSAKDPEGVGVAGQFGDGGPSNVTGRESNPLCSSRFGDGNGAISFVAPCDASEGASLHKVRLWVNAVCEEGSLDGGVSCIPLYGYQNPCGNFGCEVTANCIEDSDVPVQFNFTVMGSAKQGFFDIAVRFDDLFCSGKLDTCYGTTPDSEHIELLYDPATKEWVDTAVLALACTAGSDAEGGTWLHLGNVKVSCGGAVVATLDLSTVSEEGNQTPVNGILWSTYFGAEALETAEGKSWNKQFFNVAVAGFGADCTLSWVTTASEGPTLASTTYGANARNSYPVITYSADVTNEAGAWLCSQNELNEPGSGVSTGYTICDVPGACIGGPCVTTQSGMFQDCEDGPPQECALDGVTVTLSGVEPEYSDNGEYLGEATVSYRFYLPAVGVMVNGRPVYSQELTFRNTPAEFTVRHQNGLWIFSCVGCGDSNQEAIFGSSTSLIDNWNVTLGEGLQTMVVECGGQSNYVCARWLEPNGDGQPAVMEREFFEFSYEGVSTTMIGWGIGEGGGIYHGSQPGSTWNVELPRFFTADTGIVPPQSPWGSYTTTYTGSDPNYAGPMSYDVMISQGLCDNAPPPILDHPTGTIFASHSLGGTTGGFDRADMGTDTPLVPISDTAAGGALLPLVPEHDHLDLAYSPSSNAVLAHNASMIDLATRDSMVLAIARFDNVTNASGAVSSHLYLTRNADGSQTSWSAVSGVQTAVEAYNLVVSNGAYRDPSGSLVLVAYQYGTRLSVTGLHFFALRLIDGATPADGRIEVSLLQTFTFTNAAVEAQNWAALTPKKARTLTVDSTGQAATVTVSGLGLVDSQFGGGNPRHFLHSFTLSGDGGVYGLSSPWSVETGTVLESILGFEDNGNKVVTLRPSAGATPMVEFAMLSRVNGAVIGTRSTPFAYQTSKNFGTYQPGSGFAFGFIQGTNTAHWLRLWNSDSGTFIGGAFPTLQFKTLNKKYGQLSRIASF